MRGIFTLRVHAVYHPQDFIIDPLKLESDRAEKIGKDSHKK